MLTITADETTSPEAFRTLGGKLYREAKRLATEEAESSSDPRLAGIDPRDAITHLTDRLFRYVDGHAIAVDPRVFSALDEGQDEGLLIGYDDADEVQPILTDEHTEPTPEGQDLDSLSARPSAADELRAGAAAEAAEAAEEDEDEEPEAEDTTAPAGDATTPEVIPPSAPTVDPSDKDSFPNIATLEQFMDEQDPPISRTGLSTRPELEQAVRDRFDTTAPAGDAG